MKSIAIVIPWFGKELKGGAEQHGWQVATRLAQRGHQVEVLTTCCRSFHEDWGVNHLKAGVSWQEGLKIRRFPVDRRDREAFDRVNGLMLSIPPGKLKPGVNPVSLQESAIFCDENINSTQLLNYLKNHQDQYQAFIFIPYLYGLILKGLPIVANRAFLQPCLHDEVYAYLPQVANIFHGARGLLFISEGEAELARQLYGPGIISKSLVAGAGVEAGEHYDDAIDKIGDFLVKEERFVLYLGRRDPLKNTDLLVRTYGSFKEKYPNSSLKLVIAGTGNISFHNHISGVIDFGLVGEREKEALLANCLALFQPSTNESFSRVIMEAWFYGQPVAAHRDCLATAMAVDSAKGGWLAETKTEWIDLLAKVDLMSEDQLSIYGINGQSYANENAVWDKVIERYETALNLTPRPPSLQGKGENFFLQGKGENFSVGGKRENSLSVITQSSLGKLQEIHQLLPNIAYGDAISNHALAIRDYLRSCGYKSDILVKYMDERVAHEVKLFEAKYLSDRVGLIYHHSIGSEVTKYAIAHSGSKCLIYHNITPAEFFAPYRPEFAKLLAQGRAELHELAPHFPISVGDSAYNSAELSDVGFSEPGVFPIAVNPKKWDIPADHSLMQQLQDGKSNLLFVGRLAPNKCQDHLLEAFAHYLTMDREARLILAGCGDINDPYYCHLINTIQKLNLTKYVLIPGQVNDAQLLAFYRTAHLLWSMSEHEGFCVPLVEAMWFDIPILAYKSSAVPETLGEAGIMFTRKDDLLHVAALAKLLVKDRRLRSTVIKVQRQRREEFTQAVVNANLSSIVSKMAEAYIRRG
ncbi:glycosyltransferase [Limnofasciculus baicalensis]|uniref:Glycosyltransferase n=1 Tax=Limnofasciculus baicalensis BBK-W-15 TaxID=2699891 RepID=A0AAE3KKQ2_9CYAN|nr:glycosyltransferase [Limnofasciculus baicalensis]MCP2727770.1 glycosyltransferase [Limnofasciculus baicalensis BBK-W-15]